MRVRGKAYAFCGCLDFGTVHNCSSGVLMHYTQSSIVHTSVNLSLLVSTCRGSYPVGDPFSRGDHVPSLRAEVYLGLIYFHISPSIRVHCLPYTKLLT